nr:hypothetical protein XLIUZIGB_XLIUZIGB_CDS_0022 [Caudoviricetes sp.]
MFYEDLSIESCVDELKAIRDDMKILKKKEEELKKRILDDGREEIKGEKFLMKKSIRTKDVFNEPAFIEQFMHDKQFDEQLRGEIIELQPTINQEKLTNAIKDNKIPLDYVIPFNSVTENVVINVK